MANYWDTVFDIEDLGNMINSYVPENERIIFNDVIDGFSDEQAKVVGKVLGISTTYGYEVGRNEILKEVGKGVLIAFAGMGTVIGVKILRDKIKERKEQEA